MTRIAVTSGERAANSLRTRAVAPAVQSAAGVNAWKRLSLPSLDGFRRISEQLKAASAAMARQMELFAATAPLMLELGWPPILEASFPQMNEILVIYREEGPEAAQAYVEALAGDCYDDTTIRRKLASWGSDPLLSRRLRFLRAGVEAHLRHDYACSVPTLLPQVEGLVVDLYQGVPELEVARIEVLVDTLLVADDEGEDSALSRVDRLVREYYLQQVLRSIGRRDLVPDSLNRHCVLHGRDLAYDTKANSLRALILFDYLTTSLVIVSSPSGGVYHRAGCPAALVSRALIVLADPLAASASGRRPCQRCRPPSWGAS
jgi:hypothetical protein